MYKSCTINCKVYIEMRMVKNVEIYVKGGKWSIGKKGQS